MLTDVFDAVRDGSYTDFLYFYQQNPDVNQVGWTGKFSLLQAVFTGTSDIEEKKKICHFLLNENVNINYTNEDGNALHILFQQSHVWKATVADLLELTELLIKNGIDVNVKDKYGAISLSYAISTLKFPTEELVDLHRLLLHSGADILSEDNYGNSCLYYAKQFPWRLDMEIRFGAYFGGI